MDTLSTQGWSESFDTYNIFYIYVVLSTIYFSLRAVSTNNRDFKESRVETEQQMKQM